MTEESKRKQTEKNKTVTNKQQQESGKNKGLSIGLIILFLCFGSGGYYIWDELNKAKMNLEKLSDNTIINLSTAKKTIANLEASIAQLTVDQNTIADALNDFYRQQPESNEDWALAEIEYLLIIATHRLALAQDVKTALSAMEAAELRLKDLGNPRLNPVREQLATDINQLRSVNAVDISGLAIHLAVLVDQSKEFPLRDIVIADEQTQSSNPPEAVNGSGWREWPALIRQKIEAFLEVKRSEDLNQPLLLADEKYFLYQNLRLELENAKLAVLLGDTDNLQVSINTLTKWLNQYFDTSDATIINVLETLEHMASVELMSELPDISSSLESLRAYIRSTNDVGLLSDPISEIPAP